MPRVPKTHHTPGIALAGSQPHECSDSGLVFQAFAAKIAPYLKLEEGVSINSFCECFYGRVLEASPFIFALVNRSACCLQIKSKAMQALKAEGLMEHKEIVEAGSDYYRKPDAFAMHHYQFFQCFVVRPNPVALTGPISDCCCLALGFVPLLSVLVTVRPSAVSSLPVFDVCFELLFVPSCTTTERSSGVP